MRVDRGALVHPVVNVEVKDLAFPQIEPVEIDVVLGPDGPGELDVRQRRVTQVGIALVVPEFHSRHFVRGGRGAVLLRLGEGRRGVPKAGLLFLNDLRGVAHTGDRADEADRAGAGGFLLRSHGRRRSGDVHVLGRLVGQDDGVAVVGAAFVNQSVSVALLNDHGRLIVIHDVRGDPFGRQPLVNLVVAGDRVADDTAVPQEVVTDDRRRFALNVEGITAQATRDSGVDLFVCAQDVELVVAFGPVDLEGFDRGEGHVQARAEDAHSSHHEVVGELRADDDDRVEAVAAVDAHRGVDHVLNEVRTFIPLDLGGFPGVFLRPGQGEGLDDELVISAAALEGQHGLVVEHDKTVLTVPAVGRGGHTNSVAQEADRGLDGRKHVRVRDVRVRGPWGFKELAELEGVITRAAVQGHGDSVVVHREEVVATQAVDHQAFVEVLVVVDAFDFGPDVVHPLVRRPV